MSVTVVSSCYGKFHKFAHRWAGAVSILDPAPDAVIVATDSTSLILLGADDLVDKCWWKHPQAFYLDRAIRAATTDWVWIVDIDDHPFVGGLAQLEHVDADVWQLGFKSSEGETYIPPQLTNAEYLASERNVYVAGSIILRDAYLDVGGFADIALQDWGLWRDLARAGARFEASDRSHFHYNRHPQTRGATELTMDARPEHLAEMMEAELAAV